MGEMRRFQSFAKSRSNRGGSLDDKTKANDLRLPCSNCHRMVHAKRAWLTIEAVIAILRRSGVPTHLA